jgi:redox-sensing transcriptional repressor
VVAVVDNDPTIIGVEISGHIVQPMQSLAKLVKEQQIDIGMLAVPPEAAQEVAQSMVDAGLTGILNFAPVQLNLQPPVPIVTVDLTVSLEQLAFNVSLRRNASEGAAGGEGAGNGDLGSATGGMPGSSA